MAGADPPVFGIYSGSTSAEPKPPIIALQPVGSMGLRAFQVDPAKESDLHVRLEPPYYAMFDNSTDAASAVARSFTSAIKTFAERKMYPFNFPPTHLPSKPLESQLFIRIGQSIRFTELPVTGEFRLASPGRMVSPLLDSSIAKLRGPLAFSPAVSETKELSAYVVNSITEEKFRIRIDLNRLNTSMKMSDLFTERVVAVTGEKVAFRRNIMRTNGFLDGTAVIDFREDVTDQFVNNTLLLEHIVNLYQKWLSVAGSIEQRSNPFAAGLCGGGDVPGAGATPQYETILLRLSVTASYKMADGIALQFCKVREAATTKSQKTSFAREGTSTPASPPMLQCRLFEASEISIAPIDTTAKLLYDQLASIRKKSSINGPGSTERGEDESLDAKLDVLSSDLSEFLRTSLIELKRHDPEILHEPGYCVAAFGNGVRSRAAVAKSIRFSPPPNALNLATEERLGSAQNGVDGASVVVTKTPYAVYSEAALTSQFVFSGSDYPQTMWGHRMLLQSIARSKAAPLELIDGDNASSSCFSSFSNRQLLASAPSSILSPSVNVPMYKGCLKGVYAVTTRQASTAGSSSVLLGVITNACRHYMAASGHVKQNLAGGFLSTSAVTGATLQALGVVGASIILTSLAAGKRFSVTAISEEEFNKEREVTQMVQPGATQLEGSELPVSTPAERFKSDPLLAAVCVVPDEASGGDLSIMLLQQKPRARLGKDRRFYRFPLPIAVSNVLGNPVKIALLDEERLFQEESTVPASDDQAKHNQQPLSPKGRDVACWRLAPSRLDLSHPEAAARQLGTAYSIVEGLPVFSSDAKCCGFVSALPKINLGSAAPTATKKKEAKKIKSNAAEESREQKSGGSLLKIGQVVSATGSIPFQVARPPATTLGAIEAGMKRAIFVSITRVR